MPASIDSLASALDFQIQKYVKKAAALGIEFNTDLLGVMSSLKVGGSPDDAAKLATQFALYDKALQQHNKSFEDALGVMTVGAMNNIAKLQKEFYTQTIPSMTAKQVDEFVNASKNLALEIATMNYKGIAAAGWSTALDAFKKTIIAGGSKDEAIMALKNVLVPYGTSPLPQNVSSATTDALNQFARVYNMTMMSSMGQEWFSYTGSTMETSRCFCLALEARGFFHISEIPLLLKGEYSDMPMVCLKEDDEGVEHTHTVKIYNKTNLPEGMIVGTNQQSFFIYAGGWNCGHQIFPVSEGLVPAEIRDEVFDSIAYKTYIKTDKKVFTPPVVQKQVEQLPPAPPPALEPDINAEALAAKKKKQSEAGKKAAATKKANIAKKKAEAEAAAAQGVTEPNTPALPVSVSDKTFAGEDIIGVYQQGTQNNSNYGTNNKYRTRGGDWTPERKALHENILDKFLQGLQPMPYGEKSIVAVGGAPAAGKSTLKKTDPDLLALLKSGFADVETDAFKRALPEYNALLSVNNTDAARYTHEESKYLALEFIKRAQAKNISMVIDKIWNDGWETVASQVKAFRDDGYAVSAKYVLKDEDILIRDAREREQDTKFKVNEYTIRENAAGIKRDVLHLGARGVFDSMEVFDGNAKVAKGQPYPRIFRAKAHTSELIQRDSEGYIREGKHSNLIFSRYSDEKTRSAEQVGNVVLFVEPNQYRQYQKWLTETGVRFSDIKSKNLAEAEMWLVFAASHPDFKPEWHDALSYYTGSGYDSFNKYLRDKKEKIKIVERKDFDDKDKLLEELTDYLPKLTKTTLTWRTNNFAYGQELEFAMMKENLELGKDFDFPAYASTSISKAFAERWWQRNNNGIFLEIESCESAPVDILSASGIDERESLLHHKHKYQVVGKLGVVKTSGDKKLYGYKIRQYC